MTPAMMRNRQENNKQVYPEKKGSTEESRIPFSLLFFFFSRFSLVQVQADWLSDEIRVPVSFFALCKENYGLRL